MESEHQVNVLLVDDKPANLLAMEALLADLGYHLVRAESGEEALKRALEYDFAVIVLDVQMPGLNGFEILKLLRQREATRLTPVIFNTATYTTDVMILQGYAAGAVDVLTKPLKPEILKAKVERFGEMHKEKMRLQREVERLHGEGRMLRE